MQYLIIAYDYEDALEKRMESRPTHVEETQKLMAEGKIVSACALIEDDKMVGSSVVTNFEDEDEFDEWLVNEPYVKNGVWNMEEIQVVPIKVMPKA
ncbi:YciI family protein [Arcobacter roscoffensis]|uniref:YciI family protein n=1 Tax=Arcobacter roscoffensis TaxID=2961520 RepID=A0ABY5E5N3_9BACT|nr:YciI family protein [Arcobacter roscoffensis]UTJ06038.1 YciI family protein [Arcobacter roscoffensis]